MLINEWPAGLSRRLFVAAAVLVVLSANLAGGRAETIPETPQAASGTPVPQPTTPLLAYLAAPTRPAPPPTGSAPSGAAPTRPTKTGGAAIVPARPRQLTLLFAGDVLVHMAVADQARADAGRAGRKGYDFFPLFRGVSRRVSGADLALCHLETPVGEPAGPFAGYPLFNAPPQVVDGIRRAGYDGCSVASNHALDQGERGVVRTIRELEAAGLGHAGSARNPREAATPRIYDRSGIRVGHLSYSMSFNGLRPPPGKTWLANRIEPATVLAAARRARAAGADVVVLSLHWGTEYRHEPDAAQRRWARQLIASPDIDLIVGHHAHVVQPFQRYGDKWVVFGMGNHLARQRAAATREGVMARVTITEVTPGRWRTTRIEAIPTWTEFVPAIRLVDLPAALATPTLPPDRRRVYQAAYDHVRRVVAVDGAVRAGLVVVPPGG
jgi:poly-gamma-glutamate capsule biosynthesis protein CapA/YwtB (metallophosphatase superfamily)